MTEGLKTIIYPVTDIARAKTLYGKLVGVEPYMDEPYYVGFNVEGQTSVWTLAATARG
jgi:extradiol dioxygenase family protein